MKRALICSALLVILGVGFLASCSRKSNNPPAAINGSITTEEDTPVSISLKGSDAESAVLSFSIVTQPSHGTLSGTESNLVYTPELNFSGADSFTFKASDGVFDSNSAVVEIKVTPINDPPKAEDDLISIKEDTQMIPINVLGNDTDIDGDQLTVLGVTGVQSGSIVLSSDNKIIIYTPNSNFAGSDSFTYTVSDSRGGTDSGTVRITINSVNDTPHIRSRPSVSLIRYGSKFTYDVQARDADTDQTLTYMLTMKPDGMTIDPATGLIEWDPKEEQVGMHDVQVKVVDDFNEPASDIQTFNLTLTSKKKPLSQDLVVEKAFDKNNKPVPSSENVISFVEESDDEYYSIRGGDFITFSFTDLLIHPEAIVTSVVLCVEHYEDSGFGSGNLQWNVGTGWPDNPDVWHSISAPVHEGKSLESADSWEITGMVDTLEKINSFQLQVNNSNRISSRKTFLDNIYVIVKWY